MRTQVVMTFVVVVMLMMGRQSAMNGPRFFLGMAKKVPWGKSSRGWPARPCLIMCTIGRRWRGRRALRAEKAI